MLKTLREWLRRRQPEPEVMPEPPAPPPRPPPPLRMPVGPSQDQYERSYRGRLQISGARFLVVPFSAFIAAPERFSDITRSVQLTPCVVPCVEILLETDRETALESEVMVVWVVDGKGTPLLTLASENALFTIEERTLIVKPMDYRTLTALVTEALAVKCDLFVRLYVNHTPVPGSDFICHRHILDVAELAQEAPTSVVDTRRALVKYVKDRFPPLPRPTKLKLKRGKRR